MVSALSLAWQRLLLLEHSATDALRAEDVARNGDIGHEKDLFVPLSAHSAHGVYPRQCRVDAADSNAHGAMAASCMLQVCIR